MTKIKVNKERTRAKGDWIINGRGGRRANRKLRKCELGEWKAAHTLQRTPCPSSHTQIRVLNTKEKQTRPFPASCWLSSSEFAQQWNGCFQKRRPLSNGTCPWSGRVHDSVVSQEWIPCNMSEEVVHLFWCHLSWSFCWGESSEYHVCFNISLPADILVLLCIYGVWYDGMCSLSLHTKNPIVFRCLKWKPQNKCKTESVVGKKIN